MPFVSSNMLMTSRLRLHSASFAMTTSKGPKARLSDILKEYLFQKDTGSRSLLRNCLAECEKWTKEKGCTEFASDCELDNETSLRFHLALGFEEANRLICFRKVL